MLSFSNINNELKLYLLQKRYGRFFEVRKNTSVNSNLIIEFMGPPGVGKTSYSKALAKRLQSTYKVLSRTEIKLLLKTKMREIIHFYDFHIDLFNEFMNYLPLDQGLIKDKISMILLVLEVLECDALSSRFNGIVINDEGISHHLTSFLINSFVSGDGNMDFNGYLNNRLIIFIDGPKEVVLSRVKHRMQSQNYTWKGHKGLTDNQIMEFTKDDLLERGVLFDVIFGLKKASIIVINSKEEMIDNIELIVKSIEKI